MEQCLCFYNSLELFLAITIVANIKVSILFIYNVDVIQYVASMPGDNLNVSESAIRESIMNLNNITSGSTLTDNTTIFFIEPLNTASLL